MNNNKFDKLASEIIAGYNDLQQHQKSLVDFGDMSQSDKKQLSLWEDSMKNIPFLSVKGLAHDSQFYYVTNIKDQKLLSLLYTETPDGSLMNEYPGDWKWFSGNMSRFHKTFKDICIEEYQERYIDSLTRDLRNRFYRIQNLEMKAVKAAKAYKSFETFETFLEYLES